MKEERKCRIKKPSSLDIEVLTRSEEENTVPRRPREGGDREKRQDLDRLEQV
jgi:hypothetical protein